MKAIGTTYRNGGEGACFSLDAPPALLRAVTPADRMRLSRLERDGLVIRLDRGLYAKPEIAPGVHHELAAVGIRRPSSVVCLLSALGFHGITTQLPNVVYVGIESGQRLPRWQWPRIIPVHLAAAQYPTGIEIYEVDGIPVRMTDPARTVADCWKYERIVGLSSTIEATKMALQEKACTVDQIVGHLDHYGLTARVMPYLVGITA